jgi:hypothetical protein
MTFGQRKKLVIARDKKCLDCGTTDDLTVDHIIPVSRGGTGAMDNLRTLCAQCNRRKGSYIDWPWLERLKIAFHVDELVERTRNELKGIVTANLGNIRSDIAATEQRTLTALRTEIEKRDQVLRLLVDRTKALEKHLGIKWVKIEGYQPTSL